MWNEEITTRDDMNIYLECGGGSSDPAAQSQQRDKNEDGSKKPN